MDTQFLIVLKVMYNVIICKTMVIKIRFKDFFHNEVIVATQRESVRYTDPYYKSRHSGRA